MATEVGLRLEENRDDQDRDDVHDLDHGIDGATGDVLAGIANGVAGDGSLMGGRAFAAEVAFVDVFLGVVPRRRRPTSSAVRADESVGSLNYTT